MYNINILCLHQARYQKRVTCDTKAKHSHRKIMQSVCSVMDLYVPFCTCMMCVCV
jgi:hypothetical protein